MAGCPMLISRMEHLRLIEMDADLIMMNEKTDNLGVLPEDFIGLLKILTQPGDYCLSTSEAERPRVSIIDEKGVIYHLEMEPYKKKRYRIRGMLFCSGRTIGELLYKLKEPSFDVISGILGTKIFFRKLVKPSNLKTSMLLFADNLRNLHMTHQDEGFKRYSTEMIICGKLTLCNAVQARGLSDYEWRQRMNNEIQVALVAEQKNLPIYCPIGFVNSGTGYLIYRHREIFQLDHYVASRSDKINMAGRFKLMIGIVTVMAELHAAGIFHGSVEMQHFLVKDNLEVFFNGGDGLAPTGAIKTVTLVDYPSLAPEVAWTRRLSPQSDVYSVGRILRALSNVPTKTLTNDPNASLLSRLGEIISRAMTRNPASRPTMDGIYLRLKEIYVLPKK